MKTLRVGSVALLTLLALTACGAADPLNNGDGATPKPTHSAVEGDTAFPSAMARNRHSHTSRSRSTNLLVRKHSHH